MSFGKRPSCFENKTISLPKKEDFGTLTCTTDASGDSVSTDSGVGGYGFLADHPNTVYIVSERWPEHVLDALAQAARTHRSRSTDTERPPTLAVTTTEAFGMAAVPAAIAAVLDNNTIQRVIAIGDCRPAYYAFEKSTSKSAQIRTMIDAAHEIAPTWLAVHVKRELNTDADRLRATRASSRTYGETPR